jgi:superfamily II DNA or RNA helicase
VIIDEAHHAIADIYQRVIHHPHYEDAVILGVTATPERTDGRGFKDSFDILIQGPTVKQLTVQRYLCPYKLYAYTRDKINTSYVRTQAGDYQLNQLAEAVMDSEVRADLVKTWQKQALGKRTVVFAVNVQLSKEYAAIYNASSGYRAEHIDGQTHKDEREAIFKRFKNGTTTILCNCNIVTEGFDLPEMECVQIVRPTQSRSFWLQMVGRSLRIFEGKTHAIILDHTDNYKRLGLPDHEYDWSLDSRIRPSTFISDNAERDSLQDERRPRKIEHLEGELVEIYSNSQELENNDMVKIRIDKVEYEATRSLADVISKKLERLDEVEDLLTQKEDDVVDCQVSIYNLEIELNEKHKEIVNYEQILQELREELDKLHQKFDDILKEKIRPLNLPTPKPTHIVLSSPPHSSQIAYMDILVRRALAVKNKEVYHKDDNMLVITTDGILSCIHMMLVDPKMQDWVNHKLNACAWNVWKIWKATRKVKATQIIFSDLSTPKKQERIYKVVSGKGDNQIIVAKGRKGSADEDLGYLFKCEKSQEWYSELWYYRTLNGHKSEYFDTRDKACRDIFYELDKLPPNFGCSEFTAYAYIKQVCVALGMPEDQFQFIHDHEGEKKDLLFAKAKTGDVAVIMGSTEKLGTVVNIQDRLIAAHMIDVPWTPKDLEQRIGCIERRGNMFEEYGIYVFQYLTQGANGVASIDGFKAQELQAKAAGFREFSKPDSRKSKHSDIDKDIAITFGEMIAISRGDPRLMDKFKYENELAMLLMMEKEWQIEQKNLRQNELASNDSKITSIDKELSKPFFVDGNDGRDRIAYLKKLISEQSIFLEELNEMHFTSDSYQEIEFSMKSYPALMPDTHPDIIKKLLQVDHTFWFREEEDYPNWLEKIANTVRLMTEPQKEGLANCSL